MSRESCQCWFPVRDYNLAATLTSGQAFRWQPSGEGWTGVIAGRWVRLVSQPEAIFARAVSPQADWRWLASYLRVEENLEAVLSSFPDDEPMRAAVSSCRGLRLLRQDPWECLASFILSSTKRIVQIQQIVALVCERFGEPVAAPAGVASAFAFPSPGRLAQTTEAELRACKMGFRAPYLLGTARRVTEGKLDLARLSLLSLEDARDELMNCPGVGRKIADCVLLFAFGFQQAFPVDVWVMKALRQLYFPKRRANRRRLEKFTATHFGARAGYAQQYLFHYMRTQQPSASEKLNL